MGHKCGYCNSVFATKQTLDRHKVTSQKCLKIQSEIITYKCVCDQIFINKNDHKEHISNCPDFITEKFTSDINKLKKEHKKEMKGLKEEIKELELWKKNYIKEMSLQLMSKIKSNLFNPGNLITYTPNLSKDNITKICKEKITTDLLMDQYGIPDLFINEIVKSPEGKYGAINTNLRESRFKLKINENKIINDIKGKELTKNFKKCSEEIIENKLKELKDILKNNKQFSIIKKNVINFDISYIAEQLYVDKNGDGILTRIKEKEIIDDDIKEIIDNANNLNFKDNKSLIFDDDIKEEYEETEPHLMCIINEQKEEEVFFSSYADQRTKYIKINIKKNEDKLKHKWFKTSGKKNENSQKITHILRTEVWDTYIGKYIGTINCPYCCVNEISQLNFECGHVIAEANEGKTTLEI